MTIHPATYGHTGRKGNVLGLTTFKDCEDLLDTREEILAMVQVSLAGLAGGELILKIKQLVLSHHTWNKNNNTWEEGYTKMEAFINVMVQFDTEDYVMLGFNIINKVRSEGIFCQGFCDTGASQTMWAFLRRITWKLFYIVDKI